MVWSSRHFKLHLDLICGWRRKSHSTEQIGSLKNDSQSCTALTGNQGPTDRRTTTQFFRSTSKKIISESIEHSFGSKMKNSPKKVQIWRWVSAVFSQPSPLVFELLPLLRKVSAVPHLQRPTCSPASLGLLCISATPLKHLRCVLFMTRMQRSLSACTCTALLLCGAFKD